LTIKKNRTKVDDNLLVRELMLANHSKITLPVAFFFSIVWTLAMTLLSTPSQASDLADSSSIFVHSCSVTSRENWEAVVELKRSFFYTNDGRQTTLHTIDTFKEALNNYMKRVIYHCQTQKIDSKTGKLKPLQTVRYLTKPRFISIALPSENDPSYARCPHQGRMNHKNSNYIDRDASKARPCIECFSLIWTSINRRELELLCNVLKSNNTPITGLNFNGHNIGDEGLKLISEALQVNTSLHSLWLADCLITNKGIDALCHALRKNIHLRLLSLELNKIDNHHAAAVVQALSEKDLPSHSLKGTILASQHYQRFINDPKALKSIADTLKTQSEEGVVYPKTLLEQTNHLALFDIDIQKKIKEKDEEIRYQLEETNKNIKEETKEKITQEIAKKRNELTCLCELAPSLDYLKKKVSPYNKTLILSNNGWIGNDFDDILQRQIKPSTYYMVRVEKAINSFSTVSGKDNLLRLDIECLNSIAPDRKAELQKAYDLRESKENQVILTQDPLLLDTPLDVLRTFVENIPPILPQDDQQREVSCETHHPASPTIPPLVLADRAEQEISPHSPRAPLINQEETGKQSNISPNVPPQSPPQESHLLSKNSDEPLSKKPLTPAERQAQKSTQRKYRVKDQAS
jgi:hypothetical protein